LLAAATSVASSFPPKWSPRPSPPRRLKSPFNCQPPQASQPTGPLYGGKSFQRGDKEYRGLKLIAGGSGIERAAIDKFQEDYPSLPKQYLNPARVNAVLAADCPNHFCNWLDIRHAVPDA
jgi:hypothetical protein